MTDTFRRWWRPVRRRLTGRVAVQVAAVVAGAVLAAVVAVQYSSASGLWQQAIREETLRSGLRQEQVRALYGDEAPLAARIAAAQARAETLRQLVGNPRADSERVVSTQLAFALAQSAAPGSLGYGDLYVRPDDGYDVAQRLADAIRTDVIQLGKSVPDPEATAGQGDAEATLALWLSGLTVLVTGAAVVFAALPPKRGRSGRLATTEPELFPQPGSADRTTRRTSSVLLALWAVGVLLPFAQLALGGEEQRSQATAARTAVALTGQVAIGQARSAFADDARRTALFAGAAAVGRQIAAVDLAGASASAESDVAAAEEAAASRLEVVAARMGRPLSTADGIDQHLADALAADQSRWDALGAEQIRQAERAKAYGDWSNAAVVLISAVAAVGAVVQVWGARPAAADRRSRHVRRRRVRVAGDGPARQVTEGNEPFSPSAPRASGGPPPDR